MVTSSESPPSSPSFYSPQTSPSHLERYSPLPTRRYSSILASAVAPPRSLLVVEKTPAVVLPLNFRQQVGEQTDSVPLIRRDSGNSLTDGDIHEHEAVETVTDGLTTETPIEDASVHHLSPLLNLLAHSTQITNTQSHLRTSTMSQNTPSVPHNATIPPPTPSPNQSIVNMSSNTNPFPNESINLAGTSAIWRSTGTSAVTRLQRLQNIGSHIGVTTSPFFPRTVQEHGNHMAMFKQDQANEEQNRLDKRMTEKESFKAYTAGMTGEEKEREKTSRKIGKPMGRETMFNGADLTTVLAKKSIWAAGAEESSIGWPSRDELKYEGEYQARQHLSRKLPLPKITKLKDINRSEMFCSGEEGREEIRKMESGEISMPWRMKEFAAVKEFDETVLNRKDRIDKGLEKYKIVEKEKPEEIDVAEVREKGLLDNLWDEI